jgi:signal transduction protein with GAF and PtsI domain
MPAIETLESTAFDSIMSEVERWVAGDADPVRTLTNIACLIGNQYRCDACSIYLLDPATHLLTLSGTVGLRQDCVGEIRMALSEGLTGLVAQQRCPVVVRSSASQHPRFRYFPDAGEDLYESFLGVPIIDGSVLLGVLVIQTFEEAEFDALDVDRMIDAGRALGPRIRPIISETMDCLNSALHDLHDEAGEQETQV